MVTNDTAASVGLADRRLDGTGKVRPWRSSHAASIAVLALLASVTSIINGFTYDDRPLILENPRVHHLGYLARAWVETYWPPWMGAGLYRPLTISAFTLQWAAGHGAPWVFHAANITLYVVACLLVYSLARLVAAPLPAWIGAALFAVDPVHVEAVGNIVGQAELWAACGVVGTVVCYLRWRDATLVAGLAASERSSSATFAAVGGWLHAAMLATLVTVACMAKEHAAVTPALIVAAEVWVVADPRPLRERLLALRPCGLLLAVIVLAFVAIRTDVVGAFAGDRPNVVLEHLPRLRGDGRCWASCRSGYAC